VQNRHPVRNDPSTSEDTSMANNSILKPAPRTHVVPRAAADMLGCSTVKVQRYALIGELPVTMTPDGRVVFAIAEVEKLRERLARVKT
jgi:hypothetical protein